jgi:hypothetical protein
VYVLTVYCMATALASVFRVWGQWLRDDSIATFRAETGNRIINTVPQAEGVTISAPHEPKPHVPLCRCDGAKHDRRHGGPSVRFVPEVAMAMGDDTRWPAPHVNEVLTVCIELRIA